MGSRILAVVAAVAMVAGALFLRGRWDEDEQQRSQPLRLTCVPELEAVCEDLEGDPDTTVRLTIEEAGATADRLATLAPGADRGLDGWLTVGDWPALVDAERVAQNAPPLFASHGPLASSRLALVVWKDALPGLAGCQGTWACVGDVAAGDRARVKLHLPDPATTGTGLAALAGVAVSSFARPDFGKVDIDEDAAFQRRVVSLVSASRSVEPSVEAILATGKSAADAFVVLEVVLTSLGDIPALDKTNVIYPAPVIGATVVLGATRGQAGDRLARLGQERGKPTLRARGWMVPATSETNLPDGGVLAALRDSWRAR